MGKWRLSRGQGHFGHVLLPIISQTLLDNTAATAAAGCDDIDNSPVDAGKCRRILLPLPFLGQGVQVARVAQGRTMDDSAGEDVAERALNQLRWQLNAAKDSAEPDKDALNQLRWQLNAVQKTLRRSKQDKGD